MTGSQKVEIIHNVRLQIYAFYTGLCLLYIIGNYISILQYNSVYKISSIMMHMNKGKFLASTKH